MSDPMVKEAETAEKLAQSKLDSRKETLGQQDFEKELTKIASSSDVLQRKASSLRQVCIADLTTFLPSNLEMSLKPDIADSGQIDGSASTGKQAFLVMQKA